ncbi:hypothetical protein [Nocardia colli]|uniref:hypothetical protein n=1 Tax=Nocardia colli TaxID=2545717 RepID=UPI0035E1669A
MRTVADRKTPPGKALGENGPWVNWGIVSGHVYFNKADTAKLAAGAASSALIGLVAAAIPVVGQAFAVWWVSHSVEVAIWATAATAQNKCLALKVGGGGGGVPPSVIVTPEHFTEGCF